MKTRSRSASSKQRPPTSRLRTNSRDSELLKDEPRSEDGSESEAEMDEDGNLRGFVVPDNLIEDGDDEGGFGLSDRRLEEDWCNWKPSTKAEKRFKNVIDKYTGERTARSASPPRPRSVSTIGSPKASSSKKTLPS